MSTRKKPAKVSTAAKGRTGPPAKVGRPSSYTPELAAAVCVHLMDGHSLRKICARPDMPCKTAVLGWLAAHPEFAGQYARAREIQADVLADEIVDISDDSTNDYMAKDGEQAYNAEAVQRSRLRVDARKWYASKLAPKKYGDKQEVEMSGGVAVGHIHMTRDEWKKRIEDSQR